MDESDRSLRPTRRGRALAVHTIQLNAQILASRLFSEHPGPHLPGRIVPHVLAVPAFQIRDPVLCLVLMERHNPTSHWRPLSPSFGFMKSGRFEKRKGGDSEEPPPQRTAITQ